MTKRILILTYYFPPDLSAGSFRADALVKALAAAGGDDVHIDVITSMPNRYEAVAGVQAAERETWGPVTVTRIPLPQPGASRASQAGRFLRFAFAATRHTAGKRYDLVFATSSRLMTAVLGAGVSRLKGAPLYLDIRDIFVETMADLSKGGMFGHVIKVLDQLERWTIRQADGINVVSGGFLPYFHERYGKGLHPDVFTNGIDEAFAGDFSSPVPRQDDIIDIVYAGNIGDGQGLHLIVPALAAKTAGRARFRIVGDGGRMKDLREAVENSGVTNVILESPVPRARLIDIYREADVLFLHLNDVAAFERVIPSKLFEYAATGKPILAGVSGFCARFISEEIDNAGLFPPCDADSGIMALGRLELAIKPRAAFMNKYERSGIMSTMAQRLLDVAREGK
ncbi:glycosyltransferase family 4 protein [Phyllobacterium leguminum]|uniref:glycosyltransferase family 4 protein n=1 Tax=Phyllobacterium leguminum TaxID=314237 RepID=UPI001AECC4AB|nr:glycosyltransferase family 4 protein [Phyllobacterium leguminum]